MDNLHYHPSIKPPSHKYIIKKAIFPHIGSQIIFNGFRLSAETIVNVTYILSRKTGHYKNILFKTDQGRVFSYLDLKSELFWTAMPRKKILKGFDRVYYHQKLGFLREQIVDSQGCVTFEPFGEVAQ